MSAITLVGVLLSLPQVVLWIEAMSQIENIEAAETKRAPNREKLKAIVAAKTAAQAEASRAANIETGKKLAARPRDYSKPPAMLVGRDELRERYGIDYSREHLWRLCEKGLFPKPIKLTANRCAWFASEIEAWIAARSAAR